MKNYDLQPSKRRAIIIWLLLGLVLVYFQIFIGGITRLTGSGLSITEWEIVTGTIPPINEQQWIEEFEKYKLTPQYQKINRGMQMGTIFKVGTFKFIYFWEYLHRLWARAMGLIFLIPFVYFLFRKWLPRILLKHLGIVILLSILAATFGWIMVASGLVNRPWVNAYKLAIHLSIGISVFIALLWTYLRYNYQERIYYNHNRPSYLVPFLLMICIQIFLGGVMSGTKASLFINTWPDYHGEIIPSVIVEPTNWTFYNFNHYESSAFLVSLIQFLHRTLGYIILACSGFILVKKGWLFIRNPEGRTYLAFFLLLIFQIVIGILTLMGSIGVVPVFYGVLHQAIGVATLSIFVLHFYYLSYLGIRVHPSS